MRTAWVGLRQGASVKNVFAFVMAHGTREQARDVAKHVIEHHSKFRHRAEIATSLNLTATPEHLVEPGDVERAVVVMRRALDVA